jgi:hypothetical protein
LRAHEPIQPDLPDRVDDHLRGCPLVVIDASAYNAPRAEQQLVSRDLHPTVEDRLAGDEDIGCMVRAVGWHGRFGVGRMRRSGPLWPVRASILRSGAAHC